MMTKAEFTQNIIEPIVKEAGYDSCFYSKLRDDETIIIYSNSRDHQIAHRVNVNCDSNIAMVADVMKVIY